MNSKQQLLNGVNKLSDTVKVTLGTKGRTVLFNKKFTENTHTPVITKDGVTVARYCGSDNNIEQMAINIVREAAEKTVSSSGDGPQPLYSKVLTPNGFVEMGSLKPGDTICGTNGSFQKVLEVFPKGEKEIYEVEFLDGRVVECCEDHLWTVTTYYGTTNTVPLKNLKGNEYFIKSNGDKQYRFYTPKTVVEFESKNVPIDPYLLGVLLGDGSLSGSGDIEICIDVNKEFILNNIPKNIEFNCTYVEDKNCFRVKFKNNDLKDSLDKLNLYGVKSSTKFIPKEYLYNNSIVRQSLLQGLLDTDGYINNRGLFEFSTVSNQLMLDFKELVYSLGYSINYKLHSRDNDPNSYSEVPIHRITQLKGYKYGNKIIKIRSTGRNTKMQCIKVSNNDNLYITDNYIVTHNTTSTILLAQYLINNGAILLDNGYSYWDIANTWDEMCTEAIDFINKNSIPIDKEYEYLRKVATISANDSNVGDLLHQVISEIGIYGDIDVSKSNLSETEVTLVKGMRLHKGFFSPWMCTNFDTMEFNSSEVSVIVFDGIIRDFNDIRPYLAVIDESRGLQASPVLVYAEDVTSTAIERFKQWLIINKRDFVIVEHDGFGDRREQLINDVCLLTGARPIKPNTPHTEALSKIGLAGSVSVTKDYCSIITPGELSELNSQLLSEEISKIKSMLNNKDLQDSDRKYYSKRLANLTGGIAVIEVGGNTSVEMEEKYDRIEDAVLAVKASSKLGVSIGGGYTWVKLGNHLIKKYSKNPIGVVFAQSFFEVLKQLLINAGELHKYNKVIDSITNDNKAYDLKTSKFYDLNNYPVYDATSVLIDAIVNSLAVSKSILSIDKCIYDNIIHN